MPARGQLPCEILLPFSFCLEHNLWNWQWLCALIFKPEWRLSKLWWVRKKSHCPVDVVLSNCITAHTFSFFHTSLVGTYTRIKNVWHSVDTCRMSMHAGAKFCYCFQKACALSCAGTALNHALNFDICCETTFIVTTHIAHMASFNAAHNFWRSLI